MDVLRVIFRWTLQARECSRGPAAKDLLCKLACTVQVLARVR
jgi:hypothetical protein